MSTHASTTEESADELVHLATDLRLACMRISRRVRFESTDTVAPHQFSVLARLEDAPRSPRELAAIECVSAPSMTRTVNRLVELGLVSREGNPDDGRQVILSLTDPGRATLRRIRRKRDQWMVSRIAELPAADRDLLRRAGAILAEVAQR